MIKRRRFLTLSAAASLVGLSSRAQAKAPVAIWEGVALGAASRIVISGLNEHEARHIFDDISSELRRLERVFSLYDPASELRRLNKDGSLVAPSPDLVVVLGASREVWQASEGIFDPAIQSLWRARFEGRDMQETQIGSFADVEISSGRVKFTRPGMALTLNGIAQGYVTDRITERLSAHGLTDTAVNSGEVRLQGVSPSGTGWRLGLRDANAQVASRLTLTDRAVATSVPDAMRLPDGSSHIFDARTGIATRYRGSVSVAAETALLADALSTAACCLDVDASAALVKHFADAAVLRHG